MVALPHSISYRAVVLGCITIALNLYYNIQIAARGSGATVTAQFPMAAFMPFVVWILINLLLRVIAPAMALRRGELLTIFTMTWVVAAIPSWIGSWSSALATPTHYADTENQWAESFFNYLPWHVFPATTSRVIGNFWYGLPEGMPLPWDGWIGAILQWFGVSIAVVVFGYSAMILLRKQWVEAEKLTYPLAQLPLDITRTETGRRLPHLFYQKLFWIGFAVVTLPLLYNITTYFTLQPSFDLFWTYNLIVFREGVIFFIRVMPLMLMVIYLCPVDILGSMVLFTVLVILKVYIIVLFGGLPDFDLHPTSGGNMFNERSIVLNIESHGALIFVFLWSLWVARGHLRNTWLQVRYGHVGDGGVGEVRMYRWALGAMLGSGIYVVFWAVSLGVTLPMAIGSFALTMIGYLVSMKMIAASGVAYIYPNRPFLKGEIFVLELATTHVAPQNLVPYKVFTSHAFFGGFIIPAWPAIAHHLRIFDPRSKPVRMVAIVLAAFALGYAVSIWGVLDRSYTDGSTGGYHEMYRGLMMRLNEPTEPNLLKWGVWLFGFGEAAVITLLRARYHWFAVHPIGLIFQSTHATWWFGFNFLIAWLVKLVLLRYGGVRAYLAGKPFFYGLGIGYVFGVILSTIVDAIWFPDSPHRVHWW